MRSLVPDRRHFGFILLLLLLFPSRGQAEIRVVASIQPLHSLACAILAGAGSAELLLPSAGSAHHQSLRPSQMRQLRQADLVVWVGPELESGLTKPLSALRPGQRLLTLGKNDKINRLSLRRSGVWEPDHHQHPEDDESHSDLDPHLWLDPNNGLAIATLMTRELSRLAPEQTPLFERNLLQLRERLEQLTRRISHQLQPLQTMPYLVFHDAYQYFEHAFSLQPLGSISVDPDHRPGARRLAELRRAIATRNASCIATEPQFPPRLAETLKAGSNARLIQLDPLGSSLEPGPEAYFKLLQNLAAALSICQTPE